MLDSQEQTDSLKAFLGRRILVLGKAIFRPSGSLLRIDAAGIEAGEGQPSSLFQRSLWPVVLGHSWLETKREMFRNAEWLFLARGLGMKLTKNLTRWLRSFAGECEALLVRYYRFVASCYAENNLGNSSTQTFSLSHAVHRPLVSIVSHGELWVLAERNGWGDAKKNTVSAMLDNMVTVDRK